MRESHSCLYCQSSASEIEIYCRSCQTAGDQVREQWRQFVKKNPRISLNETALHAKTATILRERCPENDPSSPTLNNRERPIQDFLSRICWEDLCLAVACAAGDLAGWNYFQERYFRIIERAARAAASNAAEGADLAATLMSDLYLPTGGSSGVQVSRIELYHGLGSLEGWLKVIISRLAIDRIRAQRRLTSLEELEIEPVLPESDHSAQQLVCSAEARKAIELFSNALKRTFQAITSQERMVLSLYYLEGVNLKQIGILLKVHESTASRMVDRLKQQIRKGVEKVLKLEYRVNPREIMDLIETGISGTDLDIKKILARNEGEQILGDG
jgi:RNA polymerase sigma-70 factor